MFDVRFDLVCSFGENCGCAMLLDDAGLRVASYPFDWISSCSLEQNVETLTSRFSHFMRRENIVWKEAGRVDRANDVYCDVYDKHCYVHDFPKGMPLDESFPLVRAKFTRRIDRLLEFLDGGSAVCLVWREIGDGASDEACIAAIRRIRRTFPSADVRLLVFVNDPAMKIGDKMRLTALADGACVKAFGHIYDMRFNEMRGDQRAQLRVLKRLRLSGSLSHLRRIHALRRSVVRFLSLWHLTRDGRKRSRKSWTDRLCKGKTGQKVGW